MAPGTRRCPPQGCPAEAPAEPRRAPAATLPSPYRSSAPTCSGPRCLQDADPALPTPQPGAARPSPRRRSWAQGGDSGWGERLPRAGKDTAPRGAALVSVTLVFQRSISLNGEQAVALSMPVSPVKCCPSAPHSPSAALQRSVPLPEGSGALRRLSPAARGTRRARTGTKPASVCRRASAALLPSPAPPHPSEQPCHSRPLRSAAQAQCARRAGQAGELIAAV